MNNAQSVPIPSGTSKMRQRVLMLGGLGTVGRILQRGLSAEYDVVVSDLPEEASPVAGRYLRLDITKYEDLVNRVPLGIDAVINLVGLSVKDNIVDAGTLDQMVCAYVSGVHNVLSASIRLGIKRVILASSNRVTEFYEEDGRSSLGREITAEDYPRTRSTYGALKLCAESLGLVFRNLAAQKHLSIFLTCRRDLALAREERIP